MSVVEESFNGNLIILKIAGLYPIERFGKYARLYTFIMYILFALPVPILATIQLYFSTDLEEISESVFLDSEICTFVVKVLPFILNPSAVKLSVETLNSKVFNSYLPEQKKYIQEAIWHSKRNFIIFWLACEISLLSLFLYPNMKLPLKVWFPVDIEESFLKYVVGLFLFLGLSNAANSNCSIDTFLPGLLCHAVAQIKILNDNLINLYPRIKSDISKLKLEDEKALKRIKDQRIYEEICKCIEHHIVIKNYVDFVNTTYNTVLFSQFCASSIIICFCLLRLISYEPFSALFIQTLIYISTIICEIFFYCYYGTVLYEESKSINTSIYMSDWYKYDIKSRKALILMMENAKYPIIIRAGKILDVSLNLFTGILKKSYSLLAVLKSYSN